MILILQMTKMKWDLHTWKARSHLFDFIRARWICVRANHRPKSGNDLRKMACAIDKPSENNGDSAETAVFTRV